MPLSRDKNYIYIFIGVLAVTAYFLITEFRLTAHLWGFPLDDSWIHTRYSENLANGYFFHYNPGQATPGTTSPLWAFILTIPFLISPNLFFPFTLFAGSVFFLLTCFEVYKITLKLGAGKNMALLAAFVTVLCGRLVWAALSGMEITLYSYLILLTFRMHLTEIETGKIRALTGLVLGLSVIARPESYLFAAIYYIVTFFFFRDRIKNNLRGLVISIIIFLVISLPYPVFCYMTAGSFFPNTFKVQATSYKPDINYFKEAGIMFFKDNLIIVVLLIEELYFFIDSVFMKKLDKRFLLMNLWIVLLPATFSFIAPNLHHHGRYLMPLIPFMNIAAVYILVKRFNFLRIQSLKKYKSRIAVLATILIVLSLLGSYGFAKTLGTDTYHINTQQVRIAKWLNINLPDEKCFGINDIGAIAFFTKRKIFDMEGLVNPEVFAVKKLSGDAKAKEMMKLLNKNGIRYIIIYPSWYPELMQKYSQDLEQVYSAGIEEGTYIQGYEMYVYKIHWEKINLDQ